MEGVNYFSCEFCLAKFPSFLEAEAHERQCPQARAQAQAPAGGTPAAPPPPMLGMPNVPVNPMAMQFEMMKNMMAARMGGAGADGGGGMPGMPGMMGGMMGMPPQMAMMMMMKGMGKGGPMPGGADGGAGMAMPGMGGMPGMMGMPGMPGMSLPAGVPPMVGMMGGGGGMPAMMGKGGMGFDGGSPFAQEGDAMIGSGAKEPAVYRLAQEYIEKWSLEPKFKMRLVQHLLRKDDHQAEIDKLNKVLEDADVPPICRTGFLLVEFGDMNEKHTDEDFRAAILGKPMPTDNDEKKDGEGEEEDDRDMCGDFRLGRCARGDKCMFSHGQSSRGKKAGPQLPEEWMNKDVETFCNDFTIDERLRIRLVEAVKKRLTTFREDINTLKDVLKSARHPPGMLSLKLREMESGTFQTRGWSPCGGGLGTRRGEDKAGQDRGAQDNNRGGGEDRGGGHKDRGGDRDRDRGRSRSRDRSREREKNDKERSRSRSRSRKKKDKRSRSRKRKRKKSSTSSSSSSPSKSRPRRRDKS